MKEFIPRGVCSRKITFDIVDDKVTNVHFEGGCNGNLQGISKLVEGMATADVIAKLKGIKCDFKSTSCPDQLALALESVNE